MTFEEIVDQVMRRLALTSDEARERIQDTVNSRYREVTSSIGLSPARRTVSNLTLNSTTSTGLPDIVVAMSKVNRVQTVVGTSLRTLKESTYDSLTASPTLAAIPRTWAVKSIAANTVTITLDGFPTATNFYLRLNGYVVSTTLADDDDPAFPSDFHDVLVEAALSYEYRRMEKPSLAQFAEQAYTRRLSDLRMFIAKSSYLDIVQGGEGQPWDVLIPTWWP